MKFTIFLVGAMSITGLLWVRPVAAQKEAETKVAPVHTVQPKEYSVPKQEGVTTKVVPQSESFSVTSSGIKDPISLNLGWMPAEPRTSYRARYRLRVESLQDAANVSVMIREHESKEARPFTPYNREGANAREVKPEPKSQWIERQLIFTTGEKTHVLSGAIVIVQLKGELQFSALELLDNSKIVAPARAGGQANEEGARAQAQAEYQQVMAQIRAQANARVPLTPRPLVFSRAQMKYGLEKNPYHQWNDRPLLVNRAYRVPSPYVMPLPSYKRMVEEVVKYDIDGLAFFPETKGRADVFEMQEQAGVPDIGILPEFLGAFTPDHIEAKTAILRRALGSPHTAKIGGKVLITSYGAESLKPAQWKEILTTLRARVGDRFLFLPSLTNVASLHTPFMAGEPISRAAIEKEKAFLRSYLDVCDGIYFNYPPALRNKDRTFDGAFYREIFIPVFKSVLSEPAYRGKYLGLSAYKAHLSPERGNGFLEDGTRTLRLSFEAAMEARPDVIILPEWDEENENTSFRPTIYNARTSQRILRFYMSQIKGKAPTPVPNDDLSVPNLILSTRKVVTLGENAVVELLGVPDSSAPARYSVELALQDESGRVVRKFDPVTFDAAQLQEQRFNLATETIPEVRALVPVLTVRGYKGRDLVYDTGFHPVQVRATWNWDHLDVQQPMRDMLRPTTAKIAWEAPTGAAAPLMLSGSVSSPTPLALVELLGDDDEVYAVDPTDEFFRADATRELFLIEYRSQNNLEMEGSLALKNAGAQWLTSETTTRQSEFQKGIKENRLSLKTAVSAQPRWIYLAIPKASLGAAELNFDFDKARFSVPLGDVLERKMMARGFENGLHISVQPYRRQIDMPFHLNKKEVSFRVQVWPEIATEQYHLRLTGTDGRIFRSPPLLLPTTNRGNNQKLRIYSDTQKRGVDVPVAAERIPQLRYDFAPERGAVLLTGAGRPFWASLGGFTGTTTGRGTVNGLFGKYPKQVERSAPTWVSDESGPALKFDGRGTYLELPREALPWHGAFTIGFEIKPASGKDQFLLVNHTTGPQNGLALEIRDGKLQASFRNADWKTDRFTTGLAVPVNTWSAIEVRYDFEKITLSVNGRTESFPLALPAFNIGFTVIGEGWTGDWYDGRLRNLHILHNAE